MIVLDASALIELLFGTPDGREVATRVADPSVTLHAPHLVDLEVTQVIRRYVRARVVPVARADRAIERLRQMDIERYPHRALLPRIWALRDNLTAYDAAYVALAEALDVSLLTADERLANAPGHRATIEVVRSPRP